MPKKPSNSPRAPNTPAISQPGKSKASSDAPSNGSASSVKEALLAKGLKVGLEPAEFTARKKLQGGAGIPFKPGQSGNPAGRPKGARSRLEESFIADMVEAWREYGREALVATIADHPAEFVRICASLLPKQIQAEVDQTIYVVGDVPLSASEWEKEFASSEDSVEPAAGTTTSAH